MKKAILCALLIVFIVCGCNKSNDGNSLGSAISSIDTSDNSNPSQVTTTSSLKASEVNRTINKPMQYFFVESFFVGGYSDNHWVSSVDPKDPNNDKLDNKFLLKDILNNSYELYTNDKSMGTAKQAMIFTGEGPGGFEYGTRTYLLAPFAKIVGKNDRLFFNLPTKISGEEIDTLTVTNYGFEAYMSTSDIFPDDQRERTIPALATNAKIVLPKSITWDSPVNSDEKNIVQDVIKTNGAVYADPQIQKTIIDWNGDGKMETLLFVNLKIGSDGYPVFNAENKKVFSFIVLIDNLGISKTIFSQFYLCASVVTAPSRLVPCGVFDLNNDGSCEICFNMIEWECGYIAVLSQTSNSDWEIVLKGNYGS